MTTLPRPHDHRQRHHATRPPRANDRAHPGVPEQYVRPRLESRSTSRPVRLCELGSEQVERRSHRRPRGPGDGCRRPRSCAPSAPSGPDTPMCTTPGLDPVLRVGPGDPGEPDPPASPRTRSARRPPVAGGHVGCTGPCSASSGRVDAGQLGLERRRVDDQRRRAPPRSTPGTLVSAAVDQPAGQRLGGRHGLARASRSARRASASESASTPSASASGFLATRARRRIARTT